jgi:hypothetical protein
MPPVVGFVFVNVSEVCEAIPTAEISKDRDALESFPDPGD